MGGDDAHVVSPEGEPHVHHQPHVVTLALEPVTQRNHLLEGRADGPRPLKFEFMAPKI